MNETQPGTRNRSFSWSDPSATARLAAHHSGLELLQAMSRGELPPPPVAEMLGLGQFDVEEGRVTVRLTPHEFHYNPIGAVHGGVLATILDTAAGCAVHSVLPAGVGYTSLDLTTKFLRPVTVGTGELRCTGTVLSRGRRTALAEARLFDSGDRLVAHATSSCLLFDAPS